MQPSAVVEHKLLEVHLGVCSINLTESVQLSSMLELLEPASVCFDLLTVEINQGVLRDALRVRAYTRHSLLGSNCSGSFMNDNFVRNYRLLFNLVWFRGSRFDRSVYLLWELDHLRGFFRLEGHVGRS